MRFRFEISVLLCRMLLGLSLVALPHTLVKAQCKPVQIVKLLADEQTIQLGGNGVAVSGSIAIVGHQRDDLYDFNSGSAFLFDTKTGEQIVELYPDDPVWGGQFGDAVAITETVAIVGSPGAHNNNGDEFAGAIYLFDTTTHQQIAKLLAEDGQLEDGLGSSVAISGNIAIAGAPCHLDPGSAYLFDITTGQQLAKLLQDDGAAGDRFGERNCVAIDGSIAIVGAWQDANENGVDAGAAYLFDTKTGQQLAKLLPDDGAAGDRFGRCAIKGNLAIVTAVYDDDNGEDSGSAYLFDITTGQQLAKLLPDDGAAGDNFGGSVSISGDVVVIGAWRHDDNGDDSGAAYLFDIKTGQQIAKLLPDDGAAGDNFGRDVAIDENMVVASAFFTDNKNGGSGAAYLFDVNGCGKTIVVNADQYTVYRGLQISGDLSDSFNSDDSYLKFNPGFVINSAEAPVWLIFDGTLSGDGSASLEIVMESNAGTPGLTHTLEAWNWTSAEYDVVDVSTASFNNDVVITASLSSAISDYAQSGTGAVWTRVGWRKTGLVINYPWEVRLDQMVWVAGS